MYDRVTQSVKRAFVWMERLDRWGYIAVGLSLLLISMFLFVQSWAEFLASTRSAPFLSSCLTLINNLLLVVIFLELFRTIIRFLETDTLRVEPYLAVGIIACIRRMLTASAELGDLRHVPDDLFDKYLKDMMMNAGLVVALIASIYALRSRPVRSDRYDTESSGRNSDDSTEKRAVHDTKPSMLHR
jgi:phosphate starvation-inducible membrane PsiE